MSYDKELTIGLFGYGVVGQAIYQVICQTPSLKASIKCICIKDPLKKRDIDSNLFTTDRIRILDDNTINVIIEVTDDAEAAFEIVSTGLKTGRSVITANKKMVASNLPELIDLQNKYGTSLLYEAACCASIPILRNLEEYYDNDLLRGFEGIINGSTNYILSKMHRGSQSFDEALADAQEKGFAESDPSLDVKGYDALSKLSILLAHSYGILADKEEILFGGIENITEFDVAVARSRNCQIKLVAQAIKLENGRVGAFLLPRFVPNNHLLNSVNDEYNGLAITSALADQQFFYGKGAGGYPTAGAILSDLSALRYDYRYEYKKLLKQTPAVLTDTVLLNVFVSFDDWERLPINFFERVDEYYSSYNRHYRRGVVSQKTLLENDWWKAEGVSLIIGEESIGEISTTVKKQSVLEEAFA